MIRQAKRWVKRADGKNRAAYVDGAEHERIMNILKLMVHPDLQCPMNEGLEPYAMWLIIAIFCTMDKSTRRRLYTTALLEIARKNFKTFVAAVIFIIAMLLEPPFSRFFSVAPLFKLSEELRVAVKKIIKSSPLLCDHFKVCRDYVRCNITDIEYYPLAYSGDKLDGKQANVWLADEAADMPTYPIEAMRSSQLRLKEKLGIIISTQYPNENNGFTDELDKAKKALDGRLDRNDIFALIYEPDESLINAWQTDDRVLYQANPTAVDDPIAFKALLQERTMAILYESSRENFLCKHCNIHYKSVGVDGYVGIDVVRRGSVKSIEWTGTDVYLGVDLSQTDDNTAEAMLRSVRDEDSIYARMRGCIR